jgi:hypothetical protein
MSDQEHAKVLREMAQGHRYAFGDNDGCAFAMEAGAAALEREGAKSVPIGCDCDTGGTDPGYHANDCTWRILPKVNP